MALFSTENTKKEIASIITELKKYLWIFLFVVNLFFVGYYTYSVVSKTDKILLVIVNSLLLLSQLVIFGTFLFVKFKNKASKKKFKKTVKYSRYVIQFVGIVYNFVIYFVYSLTTLHLALSIISLVMLIFSIFFELVVITLEKYIQRIGDAIVKDYEESSFIGRKIANKTPLSHLIASRQDNDEIENNKK